MERVVNWLEPDKSGPHRVQANHALISIPARYGMQLNWYIEQSTSCSQRTARIPADHEHLAGL
jgi:hypothetical protein